MTEELFGYVTVGIWLTMVLVAAAGLWPRKRAGDSATLTRPAAHRRQPAITPSASTDDRG